MRRRLARSPGCVGLLVSVLVGCERDEPLTTQSSVSASASAEFIDRAWVRTRTYVGEPFIGFTYVDPSAGNSIKGTTATDCIEIGDTLNQRPDTTIRLDGTLALERLEPADIQRCGLMAIPAWMVVYDDGLAIGPDGAAQPEPPPPPSEPMRPEVLATAFDPAVAGEIATLLRAINRTLARSPANMGGVRGLSSVGVCGVAIDDRRLSDLARRRCTSAGAILQVYEYGDEIRQFVTPVDHIAIDSVKALPEPMTGLSFRCKDDSACVRGWSWPQGRQDRETAFDDFSPGAIAFDAKPAAAAKLAKDLGRVLELAAQAR